MTTLEWMDEQTLDNYYSQNELLPFEKLFMRINLMFDWNVFLILVACLAVRSRKKSSSLIYIYRRRKLFMKINLILDWNVSFILITWFVLRSRKQSSSLTFIFRRRKTVHEDKVNIPLNRLPHLNNMLGC